MERGKPSVSEAGMSFLRSEATRNPLHKNNWNKLIINKNLGQKLNVFWIIMAGGFYSCLRDPSAPLRFARDDNAGEAERERAGVRLVDFLFI